MNNSVMLNEWSQRVLAGLAPERLTQLQRDVAKLVLVRNQARIIDQKNTDGSPFEPRKTNSALLRNKPLFLKLRTRKHLKLRHTQKGTTVGFSGKSGRIARVHHYGLAETIRGVNIRFPKRELLGLNTDDLIAIEAVISDTLTASTDTP